MATAKEIERTETKINKLYNVYVKDNIDDDFIEELEKAGGEDIEISDGRDILVKHITDLSFLSSVNVSKSPELALIIKGITERILKRRGGGGGKVKGLPNKNITQKSRKGRTYRRSKPSVFTIKEITFIKVAKSQKQSNEYLIREFNKKFTMRNKSSILSKKYRL